MTSGSRPKTFQVDWGNLATLRLRARTIAEGVYAGAHRSSRRGPGVEFGGHRPYMPGDDLRWIDRHALMRHDRLIVREFETETDRSLHLIVDATASMGFRGTRAPASKVAYAALVAAALGRIALASGDPISLAWVGGKGTDDIPPTGGREAFDRLVRVLSSIVAVGDAHEDPLVFERVMEPIVRKSRRGAVIVLLSDLIDLPSRSVDQFAAAGAAGRRVVAVQVLDPDETDLPYEGPVKLRALEGEMIVEADPAVARPQFILAMRQLRQRWASVLGGRGGRLVQAVTDSDPVTVVRAVLHSIAEGVR